MSSAELLRERLREALGKRPGLAGPRKPEDGASPADLHDAAAADDDALAASAGPATAHAGGILMPAPPGSAPSAFPAPFPLSSELATRDGIGGFDQVHHHLPGFWQDTPLGRVFVVERPYDLEHRHGRIRLGRLLDTSLQVWARIGREPRLAEVDPRKVVFLDTETTGLAGGTGTVAFLIGIGHFLDGHFRMRQYFLSDMSQEPALLRALTEYLDGFEAVVTFNGKTFDLPLLDTRLILNHRRRDFFGSLPHLDLLHPARRLYRDRMESCRLGELERQVLGLTRLEDVPGAEIPSMYFRYMQTRRFRPMVRVMEHNLLDVLSLVTLTAHLSRVFSGEARLNGLDHLRLGRINETEGQDIAAVEHLEAALAFDLRPVDRDEAEQRLSFLYKRLGRWQEATDIWQAIDERREDTQLYPLEELCKYHERVAKDLPRARHYAERALLLLETRLARRGYPKVAAKRAELQKRLTRIEGRMARMHGKTAKWVAAPTTDEQT